MELLVASAIGTLTAVGIYLMLRSRTFPVILGITFLSYAVNLFLFSMGRLAIDRPPIIDPAQMDYADPVPQALVLTAIVISFGMSALIVVLALRSYLETGSDHSRLEVASEDEEDMRGVAGISPPAPAALAPNALASPDAAPPEPEPEPVGKPVPAGKKASGKPVADKTAADKTAIDKIATTKTASGQAAPARGGQA